MILLQEMKRSPLSSCHYLPSEKWRFDYFFASDLTGSELEDYLKRGWRKFGFYYFRPSCPDCRKCIPVRVRVKDFMPSRSQKRVAGKNRELTVHFGPLNFSDRIYDIYCDHSNRRFGIERHDLSDFFTSFYSPSCPSLQSEYYVNGTLAGVGFLDRSDRSLSSVYFIYDTAFSHLSLGTFSIIREIDEARTMGLDYYYLGYYIEECDKMIYKNKFFPCEHYDWTDRRWRKQIKKKGNGASQ